jgi:putative ABC transport system permease protein
LWGSMNPIGRTVQMDGVDEQITVVGVVDDIRDLVGGRRGFHADPGVTIYLSTRQALAASPSILATSPVSVAAARAAIVDITRRVDPLAVIGRETTMASDFELQLLVVKVFGGVIAALAGSALLLSIVGIYGVVAFGVAQRTREIGIRIALGGSTQEILRWITTDALRFVSLGLGIGLIASVSVSRLMRILLYNVSPLDPVVYGAVILVFGVVALVACYLPARRVTRIDPLIALRAE